MNIAKIEVSGVRAAAGNHAIIPAGILGASVSFLFTDSRWETLTKTAVFQGCVTRAALRQHNSSHGAGQYPADDIGRRLRHDWQH